MMFEGLIVTKSYAHSQARKNVRAFRLAWAAACAFRKLRPSTIENEERRGEKRGKKKKRMRFREKRAIFIALRGMLRTEYPREMKDEKIIAMIHSTFRNLLEEFLGREALYVRTHARIRVFMKDAKRERETESLRA